MRKTYHINENVSVTESAQSNTLVITVMGASTTITKDEWRDLAGIQYHVDFTPEPAPKKEVEVDNE